MHSLILIARTFLTIYVATLEGLIVQAIVKKVGTSSFFVENSPYQLANFIGYWYHPIRKMTATIKYEILWIN